MTATTHLEPDTAALRAQLERRRVELVEALRPVDDEDGAAAPTQTIGETEHLAAYQQREIDGARHSLLASELAEINDALGRLEAGSYGRCDVCGDVIAPERLEAVPAARTCIRCA